MSDDRLSCSSCRRTPLPGELMHLLESDQVLCELCFAALPEEERRPLRSERVHASLRHLSVARQAA